MRRTAWGITRTVQRRMRGLVTAAHLAAACAAGAGGSFVTELGGAGLPSASRSGSGGSSGADVAAMSPVPGHGRAEPRTGAVPVQMWQGWSAVAARTRLHAILGNETARPHPFGGLAGLKKKPHRPPPPPSAPVRMGCGTMCMLRGSVGGGRY